MRCRWCLSCRWGWWKKYACDVDGVGEIVDDDDDDDDGDGDDDDDDVGGDDDDGGGGGDDDDAGKMVQKM